MRSTGLGEVDAGGIEVGRHPPMPIAWTVGDITLHLSVLAGIDVSSAAM